MVVSAGLLRAMLVIQQELLLDWEDMLSSISTPLDTPPKLLGSGRGVGVSVSTHSLLHIGVPLPFGFV